MSGNPASELLERAVTLGASDVHLDPTGNGIAVRLRIDGRFCEHQHLDREPGERLIGRLKVMAELQVYRCDIPQEGRIELPAGREGRIAVIPTIVGEKATLRIFDAGSHLQTINDLGFDEQVLAWLRHKLGCDQGLLLVVGPSGSGKTTTLYAAIAEIIGSRGDFSHVVTVEDPVERRIEGVSQVQVDPSRQLDFAAGLRFLLRQDPEVMLVGEIRDAETARIAVRAAMTGHLVLSSLHCGRAAEARSRLLEMGVEEYAVEVALLGTVAQRLLRRRCEACRGEGCDACLASGYRGRLVVSEVLDGSETIPSGTLLEAARQLVAAGLTGEEEVQRVFGGAS